MISLNGIEKIYKNGNAVTHALKGVTLNVQQGEIVGIIGRPGAGKNALIRCINLLEKPSKGSVVVDSCDLATLTTAELRQARQKIGMIFQHFNLLTSRTVFENIALPLELNRVSQHSIQFAVHTVLDLTGLTEKANVYPNELTNAEKQRVAIARALVNRPKILLCEEATASLDPAEKQSILHLLSDINTQFNLTILLITHELDVIKSLCHRALVLEQGEVVEQGTVINLLTCPQSNVTREFIKKAACLDLPSTLRNRLSVHPIENSNAILHIAFTNPSDQEHSLAALVKQCNVSVNIIQAHLETLRGHHLGAMIVEIIGLSDDIQKAVPFLEHIGLHIEVLGYAPRTA